MITSGNNDTSKSMSWKVLETALSHLKYNLRDKLDIIDLKSSISSLVRIWKYATRVSDVVLYEFYEWCIFQLNTRVYIINDIVEIVQFSITSTLQVTLRDKSS